MLHYIHYTVFSLNMIKQIVIYMKIKHLIIVSLLLAVLTIGAVSAAEDAMSDDNLTVEDEGDVQQVPFEEDELGDEISADDFYVDVEEKIAVNNDEAVILISDKGSSPVGNLTINVGERDAPAYNEVYSDAAFLNLEDLNITEVGNYRIVVNFVPLEGSPIKLIDTFMNVTQKEGYE